MPVFPLEDATSAAKNGVSVPPEANSKVAMNAAKLVLDASVTSNETVVPPELSCLRHSQSPGK